jgi:hypothetical protein
LIERECEEGLKRGGEIEEEEEDLSPNQYL